MEKNKASISGNPLLFLLLLITVTGLIAVLSLMIIGNTDEVYPDIISEWTSRVSSNRSAEIRLFWMLLFGGIGCCAVYEILRNRKKKENISAQAGEGVKKDVLFLLALCATQLTLYVLYSNISLLLIFSIVVGILLLVLDTSCLGIGLLCYFFSYYGTLGIYRLYAHFSNTPRMLSPTAFVAAATLLTLVFCIPAKRGRWLRAGALFAQPFISGLFFVFLIQRYTFNDASYTIPAPLSGRIAVYALTLACAAEGIYVLMTSKRRNSLGSLIALGACVAIFAFCRFSGTGAIIASDMHHPGENIITFEQIFELGQPVFSVYTPVSGLFAALHGAVLKLFGAGTMANYALANNLFYTICIIMVVGLLHFHVDHLYILLVALLFRMRDYDRPVFIVPAMLLLTLPALWRKRGAWLICWLLVSYLLGLYYPVYGAAVCLAFVPMGLHQLIGWIREDEWRRDLRCWQFDVALLLAVGAVVAGIPLLIGTFQLILVMAKQTTFADGISIFGQRVANAFVTYLPEGFLRRALYYAFRYTMICAPVWLAAILSIQVLKAERHELMGAGSRSVGIWLLAGSQCTDPCRLGLILAATIMPVVGFSYAIVRMDTDVPFARTEDLIKAAGIMTVVYAARYLKNDRRRAVLVTALFTIPALMNSVNLITVNDTIAQYTVPPEYTYINDAGNYWGEGFLSIAIAEKNEECQRIQEAAGRVTSHFGTFPNFVYYYALKQPLASFGEAKTVKSFSAAQAVANTLRNSHAIVGTHLSSSNNYYLYHWLLTSGAYSRSAGDGLFHPNDIQKDWDTMKLEHRSSGLANRKTSLGKHASSWGNSMQSLNALFTDVDLHCKVKKSKKAYVFSFDGPHDGDEADFLYLEFDGVLDDFEYTEYDMSGEKAISASWPETLLLKKNYNPGVKVFVNWQDDEGTDCQMTCNLSKGKLLIPLGAGQNWLLNDHEWIRVLLKRDKKTLSLPKIASYRFLKLREVT